MSGCKNFTGFVEGALRFCAAAVMAAVMTCSVASVAAVYSTAVRAEAAIHVSALTRGSLHAAEFERLKTLVPDGSVDVAPGDDSKRQA